MGAMVPLVFLTLAPVRYVTYGNARYGFFLERPTFLMPQRAPDNGDGREFRSGAIVLCAYGEMNTDGATAASVLQGLRGEAKGGKVSLAVTKDGWCALSYTKGGMVFYDKTFVGKETMRTVQFEYPVTETTRMAPVVTRVVRSFHPTPVTTP